MIDEVPLRRNTRFQLLWIGGAVSQLGTEMTRLAMPLLVLGLTGSPAAAGLVAGAAVAGRMVALVPAGVWVDRWDRRRTLVAAQAARVVCAVVLLGLVATGAPPVWAPALLGSLDGVGATFTDLVRSASIRGLVPPTQLRTAYVQEEARTHAAWLAGPPIGGLLYAVAPVLPFAVDAVTFAVALVCAAAAPVPRKPAVVVVERGTGGRSMRREAADVLRRLWRRPGLRAVYGVLAALNLLGGAFMIPLIALVSERGGGAAATGAVLAGAGIGGLVGSLLAGRVGGLLPVGPLMLVVVAVFGTVVAAMALPFGPWWPVVPLAVVTPASPVVNVVMNEVTARLVPEDVLGRVDAVLTPVARDTAPVGPVLGGALAAGFGAGPALVLVGAALLVAVGLAATAAELRRFTGADPGPVSSP
ncbi:MFS transporter [Pseudonocardia humida]|uniref:MFS transporter n=1 Tax=Pseudonocardia humida TaxID=2800819 RepID=A0ABT0ZZS7_9PSEU|nr:MFS transporter [Pseudonocardia humida]MCO1656165.1 MFS transporter [Pseudonocardia humida]